MIRVVIVDDYPVVRAGMMAVLNAAADISVAAEGANGGEALTRSAIFRIRPGRRGRKRFTRKMN